MTGRPDRTEAADPFGTAAIRDRVLRIWAASPERLREDANSEDDLVHGGYRNRLVVELAQNAADAAAASGRPGRLLLRLEENRLLAANTGAPLDAAGVLGLSTLRASAKRDDGEATGRFGVGFAAVLAITDTPAVAGRDAAVRFDRQDTLDRVRALAAHHPALAAELNRRQDRVPALRLPFPGSGSASVDVPQGYDTVVVLPLRDARAHELADTLLGEVDDALLLALPALAEVVIERDGHAARRLADVHDRWLVHSHRGRHLDIDLEHLPVEDRERSLFEVTWAVPLGRRGLGEGASQDWAAVVHAPTPTDEPLPWPVMLLARLPVEPDRRTVHPGPVADAVIAAAASAFAELAENLVERGVDASGPLGGRSVLDLLPSASAALPAGWFDASLREAVLARLRSARVLPRAGGRGAIRPRDAVVLEGPGADHAGLVAALGARFESLVDVPAVHGPLLRMLDVARAEPADLVEQWPGPSGPDADDAWRQWLASLAPAAGDPAAREALTALAVPVITEGGGLRTVRGARGTVLLEDVATPVAEVLARYGVRIIAPRSAADATVAQLLHRLGAQRADAPSLLAHPAVVAAVRASVDDPDAVDLTEAVLTLVQQCLDAGHDVGGLPWLTELAVPDTEGDLVPAGLLLQPGSPMAQLVDTDAAGLAGQDLVHRWRSDVLHAVGVAARPVLVCAEEVDLRELGASGELPGLPGELDGMADWAEELAHSASRAGRIQELLAARIDGELVAVRDLDLVRQDALAGLVDLLLADPAARRALVEPVGVLVEGTRGEAVTSWRGRRPSYTAWWLRSEIGWPTAGPGTDPVLAALLPRAPHWLDRLDTEATAALGVVTGWSDLDAAGWRRVLARLDAADDGATATPAPSTLLRVWSGLGAADLGSGDDPAEVSVDTETLWALDATLQPVRAADPVVVDGPHWLQRTDLAPFVVATVGTAARLADLLDLELASRRSPGRVSPGGMQADVPSSIEATWPGLARRWVEHDDLRVDGVRVDWWVEDPPQAGPADAAVVHAATTDGLARGLAWAGACWPSRHAIGAMLAEDPQVIDLLVDDAFG